MRKILAVLALSFLVNAGATADLVVDDFSQPGVSSLGTSWQGFTDRVMGGRSTIEAGYVERGEQTVLAMRGNVSLANNGGFVQVRLPLAARGSFDASEYSGIAVEVRGGSGSYYIHLRTASTRRPWQYYAAALDVDREWKRVVIPFGAFEGEAIRGGLDSDALLSLALVAASEEFSAEIEIRRIEFIR